MTTVVFADRDGSAFGPLSERIVPALLPLQGVPALERMLTALVSAGIRDALLVVGPRADEIEKRFGKGIRWGIALEYVRRGEEETPGDVLRRLEHRLDGETLVLRGDVGAHAAAQEFLREVDEKRGPIVAGLAAGRPAGFWRLLPGAIKKKELPREPASPEWTADKDHVSLPLATSFTLLDSVAAYRAADRSEKPAVSLRAEVEKGANLHPGSTVGEEALVLAGATLAETSILPRTVIPQGVSLARAVVSGNLVVDAVSGSVSRLTDLLPPSGSGRFPSGKGVAFVLFLMSLPLWPVAFLWSLIANAGHPTRELTWNGNGASGREPFTTFRFETAIPVLRDLPLLLAVLSGKLALTGVTPLSPTEEAALTESWEEIRLEAPAGLLSLVRLAVPASAPVEVTRLVDAFEARRPSPLLWRALRVFFTARAWTASNVWNPDQLAEEESR
jgi:mannose-1-phosphate guanylyltransferase/phosphomannomutase